MSTPSSVSQYPPFQLVRLTATFVSTDLVTPADPSTIYLFTRNDYGSVSTYKYLDPGASIMRAGVGAYWREDTANPDGRIPYFWLGTGGVQAAEQWQFNVEKSIFNL